MFEKDNGLEYVNEERSLAPEAMKGGAWVFSLKVLQRGLGFVRTIILARLLAPTDFGLMGIAVLAINMLDTFSKTGFETALIQKKEEIKDFLDTAWTVHFLRSIILFLVLFFGAPFVAQFFKTAQALPVIRVLACIELFMGLQNIGAVYFFRELQFGKRFFMEFSGLIVNIAVSITLAFVLRNVWSLVYGSVAGSFVTCIMSYILHSYRPRIKFDLNKAKYLFNYGKWLFVSSILLFLITQGDNAFVGKMIGIAALGFYQMAYNLANAPATEVAHVVSQVMFPVYSRIQEDLVRLKKVYLEVLELVVFISVPIAALIFVFSKDFTFLFLGEKWMPMVPAMQILAWAGLLRAVSSVSGSVFFALKKTNIEAAWELVRLVVLACLIYPLSKRFGISGTSIAVCFSIGALFIGFVYWTSRVINLRVVEVLKTALFPVLSTVITVGSIILIKNVISITNILTFIFVAVSSVIIYLFISYIFSKFTGYKIFHSLTERMKMMAREA